MLRLLETFFLSCTGTFLDEDETCETFLIETIFFRRTTTGDLPEF